VQCCLHHLVAKSRGVASVAEECHAATCQAGSRQQSRVENAGGRGADGAPPAVLLLKSETLTSKMPSSIRTSVAYLGPLESLPGSSVATR